MYRNSSSTQLRPPTYVKGALDEPGMLHNLPSRSRYGMISSKTDTLLKTKSPGNSKLSPINSTSIERNLKDSGSKLLSSIRFHDSKEQSEEMRTKVFMNMLSSGTGCAMNLKRDNQIAFREIGLLHGMNNSIKSYQGYDRKGKNGEIHLKSSQSSFQSNSFSNLSTSLHDSGYQNSISSPRVRIHTPPMPGAFSWGTTKK